MSLTAVINANVNPNVNANLSASIPNNITANSGAAVINANVNPNVNANLSASIPNNIAANLSASIPNNITANLGAAVGIVNVGCPIEHIQLNGVEVPPVNKTVNLEIEKQLKEENFYSVNLDSKYELPAVGTANILYITDDDGIWVWIEDQTKYIQASVGINSISIICGGNATNG